jgi:excisionase family DNA binding protein
VGLLQTEFDALGMSMQDFNIRMGLHPDSLEVVTRMGYGTTYTQMKAMDVGMAAAEAGGGGNLAEVGMGMMGMTAMQQQQQALQQQQQGAQPQGQQTGQTAPTEVPAVMTPAQAAAFVQVSESDIVAAIEAGDLKARKIGTAYRISKANLEDFLSG